MFFLPHPNMSRDFLPGSSPLPFCRTSSHPYTFASILHFPSGGRQALVWLLSICTSWQSHHSHGHNWNEAKAERVCSDTQLITDSILRWPGIDWKNASHLPITVLSSIRLRTMKLPMSHYGCKFHRFNLTVKQQEESNHLANTYANLDLCRLM